MGVILRIIINNFNYTYKFNMKGKNMVTELIL
jgi:hypothetical protein